MFEKNFHLTRVGALSPPAPPIKLILTTYFSEKLTQHVSIILNIT